MADRPDPKSFDTLEKAQAEIARLYARDAGLIGAIDALLPEIEEARRETSRLLADIDDVTEEKF